MMTQRQSCLFSAFCLEDFQGEDGTLEMSLMKGECVEVLVIRESGWTKVSKAGGRIGYVPISYLERKDRPEPPPVDVISQILQQDVPKARRLIAPPIQAALPSSDATMMSGNMRSPGRTRSVTASKMPIKDRQSVIVSEEETVSPRRLRAQSVTIGIKKGK